MIPRLTIASLNRGAFTSAPQHMSLGVCVFKGVLVFAVDLPIDHDMIGSYLNVTVTQSIHVHVVAPVLVSATGAPGSFNRISYTKAKEGTTKNSSRAWRVPRVQLIASPLEALFPHVFGGGREAGRAGNR